MIILCSANPRSLITAAVLSRFYNYPALCRADYTGSILSETELIDSDTFSLSAAYHLYRQSFKPVSWLESPGQGKKLAETVYYAARFKARDRYSLVLQVLNQALDKGVEYVLAKVSPEAKELLTRARRVCMELHRVYGFIRFNPTGSGTMAGRAELTHDTADLVLSYFARKYHGYRIVLLTNGQANIWDKGVTVTDAGSFESGAVADEFDAFWNAYYDSQVIDSRLNKKLARKHLPKKYWSWVPEGKKLE